MIASDQLAYLATPYSKYADGLDAAFAAACRLAADLVIRKINVFSPIVHSHMIARLARLDPLDHSIWLPLDEFMMRRCDVLLVAQLPGWEESVGVAHEIDFFLEAAKPVFVLTPETMAIKPFLLTEERVA